VPVICAVAFAVPLFLIIGYLGPTRPSDKPFQKETAQQREELNSCFDKGDEIGDTYHVIEGSKSAGTFTEDNFEHGFARERYRDSECGKLQGVKCQRACKYGFRYPLNKLNDLWKEEDFQLKETPTTAGSQ
jgi:hypothetical protein